MPENVAAVLVQILPLVLIVVVFYFLLIRPQRKKDKEVKNMLANLKVGDRITTGDGRHCWLQLASPSDSSTVSVYLTNESADKVDTYGAYGRKGTTLQVRGTFNLACPDHDGASDLHAQVVTVTEKGKATPDEFDINAFIPGMVTVMIGLAMMVVFYLLRERQR